MTDEAAAEAADRTDATNEGVQSDPNPVEERARRMGWRPEEEWNGPPHRRPPKFLSAEEYIEKTESEVPVMRERLRFYDEEVVKRDRLVKTLDEKLDEQGKLIRELIERNRTADQRALERARKELQAMQREAVANADTAMFERAAAQIAEIDEARKTIEPPAEPRKDETKPQIDPYVQEWVGENPWFANDQTMHVLAQAEHARLLREKPNMSLRENLAEVRAEVMRRFPEKFENGRRAAPAAVAAPAAAPSTAPKKKGRTVSDLPQYAQTELARFKRLIPGYTDEQYLKDYQWD